MPIDITNNSNRMSLNDLCDYMRAGYSVLKSPHVGNQHPSNLLCAALGIPMEMVSFTQGATDQNFHPHVRIKSGSATQLYDPQTWTPFAVLPCGADATVYHQNSLRQVFPQTDICTDVERMCTEQELTQAVLRTSNGCMSRLWYRMVDSKGTVSKRNTDRLAESELETNVFAFSNHSSGWLIPNRAHIVFTLAWQSLSSGRDCVYHLAGPQMVGYVGKISNSLGKMYDALRREFSELPETLQVHIVPVSDCRLLTHVSRANDIKHITQGIAWYENLANENKRHASAQLRELVETHHEPFDSIEKGGFMSQHDLTCSDDLYVDPWMLETPLYRVQAMYQRLLKLGQLTRV